MFKKNNIKLTKNTSFCLLCEKVESLKVLYRLKKFIYHVEKPII